MIITLETINRCNRANINEIIYSEEAFEEAVKNTNIELIFLQIKPYIINDQSNNVKDKDILGRVVCIRNGEIDVEVETHKINDIIMLIQLGYKPSMRYVADKEVKAENSSNLITKIRKIIAFDMLSPIEYDNKITQNQYTSLKTTRLRGFEKIKSRENEDLIMPQAQTRNSAGYDFFAQEDIKIQSNILQFIRLMSSRILKKKLRFEKVLTDTQISDIKDMIKPTVVKTGIKVYMQADEDFDLYNRSSGPKKGLILANSVGIIDSDYYENEDNDGEIGFLFYNILPWNITIKKGERIGQGIFRKFLKTDDDNRLINERSGGIGSTDIKKEDKITNTKIKDCILRNSKYMNFEQALEKMMSGQKVKLPSWSGYWTWENDTIMMHCKKDQSDNGKSVLDIRETQRVGYTIKNILSNKWIIADETNCPLLGGIVMMDEEDAKMYIERGMKVKQLENGLYTFCE